VKVWSEWQDLNLRPLRPERSYLLKNVNGIRNFRTTLTRIVAFCSRGFGGQSVVENFSPIVQREAPPTSVPNQATKCGDAG
jgi:hypothetical protein